MAIEIKNRWNQQTLFSSKKETLREATVEAVASDADLRDANLSDADLSDANLSDANLSDADLRGANLRGADLSDADLRGANLRGADLSDANLSDADLRGANLSGADLSDADLRGANLRGADLSDANLSDANLSDADLRAAIGLTEAQLRSARTNRAKSDLWGILATVPNEVPGLRAALVEGRVDGLTYAGECACLVGTVANVRHCAYDAIPELLPDSDRLAERWFLAIKQGDTPETNPVSKLTVEWIDEWLQNMQDAFGPKEPANAVS